MERVGLMAGTGGKRLWALKEQVSSGSSANLEEARGRVVELYRRSVRAVPLLMDRFNLEGVISKAELRSKIMHLFRKHTHISNPKVLDMMVIKGLEELESFLSQSKQRHHLLAQYVLENEGFVQPNKLGIPDHGESDFLKNFLRSNSA